MPAKSGQIIGVCANAEKDEDAVSVPNVPFSPTAMLRKFCAGWRWETQILVRWMLTHMNLSIF